MMSIKLACSTPIAGDGFDLFRRPFAARRGGGLRFFEAAIVKPRP
jgi:hypothetical protein